MQLLQDVYEWHNGSTASIIGGDFNSPSHLDWIEQTRAWHCNTSYEWPTTRFMQMKGYTNVFREIHPSPVIWPGYTWPSRQGHNRNNERIDFVFYKNSGFPCLKAGGVQTLFKSLSSMNRKHAIWPSDHLGVSVLFGTTVFCDVIDNT
jgi:exonuclease III